ncbi:MAG: hypothetical protein AAF628_19860 [Planctomycetota bacterium]
MAQSSTAIALETLGEKSPLKTPAGQSTFAVLLFQDIAVSSVPLFRFIAAARLREVFTVTALLLVIGISRLGSARPRGAWQLKV